MSFISYYTPKIHLYVIRIYNLSNCYTIQNDNPSIYAKQMNIICSLENSIRQEEIILILILTCYVRLQGPQVSCPYFL